MVAKRSAAAHESSDSDSEDLPKEQCAELRAVTTKGMKESKLHLFRYERSFMYGADGPAWGDGPDLEQRRSFLLFMQDPKNAIFGSPSDDQLRPRLNILQAEKIFAHLFVQLQADATEILRRTNAESVGNQQRTPMVSKATLSDPMTLEVFAELTAMFLTYTAINNNIQIKRPISDTVGLLAMTRSKLMAMQAPDLQNFHGRSLVSLLLDFANVRTHRATLMSTQIQTQTQVPGPQKRARQDENQPPDLHQHSQSPHDRSPSPAFASPPAFAPATSTGKTFKIYKLAANAPKITCARCTGQGHAVPNCYSQDPPNKSMKCFVCQGIGHFAQMCPSPKVPK
jgi:hypothetical protein